MMNEITLTPSPINGYFCASDPGEPCIGAPRLSINDKEARLLTTLFAKHKVLEIGTGLGVSTKAIAINAISVVTVDIDPWVWENFWPTLPANVTCYKSLDDIPANTKFTAAFIDGLHTEDQVTADLKVVRNMVIDNGLIILHDLYISGVEMALRKSKLEFVHIQTRAGMAIIC